jgi:hypothetical protein
MRVESMLACALAAAVAAGTVASDAAAGTTPQWIVVSVRAPATTPYSTAFTVAADSRTADDPNAPLTGLTVSYSASGVCTISGNRVTVNSGTGTCTVRFDQAGDATYAAATEIAETVTATKVDQTITFGPLPSVTYKDPDFQVDAITSSNLDAVFSASGSCTINGTTVHVTGGGSCTITASQPGDANYNAASPVSQTFVVAKTSQVITFLEINDRPLGSRNFHVHATSDSRLPVSYAAMGACTVAGSLVHLTRVGICTIIASQPGDANYKAAKKQSQSFAVERPACSVPRLVGKTLPAAKHALARSHCGVGAVRYQHAAAAKRGHVVAQDRPAGRHLPAGTKIGFVVGRR